MDDILEHILLIPTQGRCDFKELVLVEANTINDFLCETDAKPVHPLDLIAINRSFHLPPRNLTEPAHHLLNNTQKNEELVQSDTIMTIQLIKCACSELCCVAVRQGASPISIIFLFILDVRLNHN